MVNLDFSVDDDDPDFGGLAQRLERYGDQLAEQLDAFMERLADEIRERLEQLTPVNAGPNYGEPPGTTARSWFVLPVGAGDFFITNSNEPVITYITMGTAAHWVFPTVAKALSWIDETGGRRFSKGHMVSGIIGVDIETMVMNEFDPYIEAGLDQAIDAADRVAGFE